MKAYASPAELISTFPITNMKDYLTTPNYEIPHSEVSFVTYSYPFSARTFTHTDFFV
jgi:hypothetical protein